MNQFIFSARLTADPEIRYSSGAKKTCVATFNVAIPRKFKQEGQPDADFFQCVAFGKTAENIEKYIVKGSKIFIQGEVQNNNYESNGQKHYGTKIVVNSFEFAESKKAATEQNAAEENPFEAGEKPKKDSVPNANTGGFDDVPFF